VEGKFFTLCCQCNIMLQLDQSMPVAFRHYCKRCFEKFKFTRDLDPLKPAPENRRKEAVMATRKRHVGK